MADELRDELPEDLDASGYVGPYKFPDNSRRRVPGAIYLVIAARLPGHLPGPAPATTRSWSTRASSARRSSSARWASTPSPAVGAMTVDEREGLVTATNAVGFPVGHASAQLAWRGLRSRPTWRILCYSTEEPPRRRGFVLIDAVDGHVVEQLVEDNPEEDWVAP